MRKQPIDTLNGNDINEAFLRSQNTLAYQASPHLRKSGTVQRIMLDVLIALLPAVLGSLFFFGARVLAVYAVSVFTALLCDFLAHKITKRPHTVKNIDFSAVVTGVLFAMSVPSTVPLWMVAVGAAFGIVVGKELFGGIGYNFLNPALTGRALLRIVFPATTMAAPLPAPLFGFSERVDTIASATPLQMVKAHETLSGTELWNAFIGLRGGKLGETSVLLILIGAIYLLYRGVISPRIPTAFFASVAAMAFIFAGPSGLFSADASAVLAHLMGGTTLLGGFFMVTDYGSSPSAPSGQVLYGVLCGVVTMLFRLFSPWAEGFTFAVLIVNLTVPLINRWVRPRVLGEAKNG